MSDVPPPPAVRAKEGVPAWAKYLVFAVVMLTIVGMIASNIQGPSPATDSQSPAEVNDTVMSNEQPAAAPKILLPDELIAFDKASNGAKASYAGADNDLKKSVVRKERDAALRAAVPGGDFTSWPGTLKQLTTNGDGNAVISVQPDGCDCTVETWNNSFSDIEDRTLIKMRSPLYQVLLNMHEGDRVSISGHLIRERSMTEEGSVDDPAYIARFRDVQPLQ